MLPKDLLREEEFKFIEARLSSNEVCLYKWIASVLELNSSPSELMKKKHPRIGVCTSGGGFRAAIAARRFTKNLNEDNFLPSIAYFACTSGSTWFMTDWLKSGQIYPETERDVFDKEATNSDYIDGLFRIWLKRNLVSNYIIFIFFFYFIAQPGDNKRSCIRKLD